MNIKTVAALAAVILTPATVHADADFYVELGTETAPDEAPKQWATLVKNHKTTLDQLRFFPKSVIKSGNTVATRIQAGPIATKEKAQKICSKLFKENVACFVIEGLSSAPPKTVMNLSETSIQKPQEPEQKPRAFVQLPWLVNNGQGAQPVPAITPLTNTPPPATNQQGEVKVAEAIRVPLSFSENQPQGNQVVVRTLPTLKQPYQPPTVKETVYADESAESGPGWLTVGQFLNDGIASSFWDEVRASAPKSVKKLRVRYNKLEGKAKSRTSMRIGPFASSNDAYQFCRDTIQADERGLECDFAPSDETQVPSSVAAPAEPEAPQTRATATAPIKQYWVQVLNAPSQMDAVQQWERLKSDNADLLQGLRSTISGSLSASNSYTVRVGPLADNDAAIDLCTKMQIRGIQCSVLMYSNGR